MSFKSSRRTKPRHCRLKINKEWLRVKGSRNKTKALYQRVLMHQREISTLKNRWEGATKTHSDKQALLQVISYHLMTSRDLCSSETQIWTKRDTVKIRISTLLAWSKRQHFTPNWVMEACLIVTFQEQVDSKCRMPINMTLVVFISTAIKKRSLSSQEIKDQYLVTLS